ncbi:MULTISPECIES: acyl-CoA thioesterase [Pseudofrankia]|uniref:acyl-CoA thioesterase n=1 Tax=Pseudofrankia TaxID=2994363 RepID=UPI000234C864|nr:MULTISPECIES: thioesterase family protein [Pseudofrankia]OHV34403.1 thioesterase [Pseudofrankia sp. EUN1h]
MDGGRRPVREDDRRDLARYPWVHEIRARFADVDNLGHINNVAVVAYYEDARAAFNNQLLGLFGTPGSARSGPFHFVVAQSRVDYLAEAHYPANYEVGVAIGWIGRSSVVYFSGLFHEGTCLGLCDTVLVHRVDGSTTPVPPDRRALLEKMAFRAG